MSLTAQQVQKYKTISLQQVLRGGSCDSCKLPMRLLNIRRSEKNFKTTLFTYRRGITRPSQSVAEYDRMFLLSDLLSSSCCVIFSRTSESTRTLVPEKPGFSVGEVVVVIEPRFINQYLDDTRSTSVIRVVQPFFKYNPSIQLPTIPIQLQSSSFAYFHLPRVQISLSSFRLNMSCGGSLCNRLPLTSGSTHCGCVVKTSKPGFVLEADLDTAVEMGDAVDYSSINGSIVSGLRFTKVFIEHSVLKQNEWRSFDLLEIKNCCNNVMKYIHTWDISGWVKTPTEGEDHTLTEARVFHIVDLRPNYCDEGKANHAKFSPVDPQPIDGNVEDSSSASRNATNNSQNTGAQQSSQEDNVHRDDSRSSGQGTTRHTEGDGNRVDSGRQSSSSKQRRLS